MVTKAENCWFAAPYNELLQSSPTLGRLRLRQSEVTPSSLQSLLRMTPHLREFECDHRINTSSDRKTMRYFQCAAMDAALQSVRSSLETLRIHIEFFTQHNPDICRGSSWGLKGMIKPLVDFPRLTGLDIPLELLVGWRPINDDEHGGSIELETPLPASLKDLTLFHDFHYFDANEWKQRDIYSLVGDYVQSLAATDTHVPNILEEISLRLPIYSTHNLREELELTRLEDACTKSDIMLDVDECYRIEIAS